MTCSNDFSRSKRLKSLLRTGYFRSSRLDPGCHSEPPKVAARLLGSEEAAAKCTLGAAQVTDSSQARR
ncbi:MAG: hypothetical protein U9R05_11500 [Chloroflexota bacterium]|nr:hypothetical protein [Chloroflexota bacterium]